jgi:hypothetical protein
MRQLHFTAAVCLLLALGACQGAGLPQATGSSSPPPPAAAAQTAAPLPAALQQALTDLDSLGPPAGVDPGLFAALKQALRRDLVAQAAGSGPPRGASCLDPLDSLLRQVDEGGTDYLEWPYTNRGDFDLNGESNLADLNQLARNFRLQVTPETDPRLAWVDGDRNGEVNVADLTVLGRSLRQGVTSYSVYRHPAGAADPQWVQVGDVPIAEMATDVLGGLGFRYPLEADHAGYVYKVVPRRVWTSKPSNEVGDLDAVPAPSGAVSGRITDPGGQPVANVAVGVYAGGYGPLGQATTDANGLYLVSGIAAGYAGAPAQVDIQCAKAGYADSSRSVSVLDSRCTVRNFTLLPRTPVATVSGAKGGSAALKTDLNVTLPPGGLVHADGTAVTGPVKVNLTYVDPLSPQQLAAAPGDMSARQQDGTGAQLASLGMAEVYLDDGRNPPANLAPGQQATLTFPIAESLRATAPASIGLYSFNKQLDQWVEESTAAKNPAGTAYVAQVGHFSYWNCDRPVKPTHILVKVVDQSGAPLADATITSAGVSYAGTTFQNTTSSGTAVFTVEQSATEEVSVEYLGDQIGVMDIATPDQDYDAAHAPLVATFTLPANAVSVAVSAASPNGFALPYASVYIVDAGNQWQRMVRTGGDGEVRTALPSGAAVNLSAAYGNLSSAPLAVTVADAQPPLTLVVPGATAPPIARFKINTPDIVVPQMVTLDASISSSDAGVASYHWRASGAGASLDVTSSDPTCQFQVTAPGGCYITLVITDNQGVTDLQTGQLCVY